MQKSILSIAIFLASIFAPQVVFAENPPQKFCVALDKNAHNSIWTRRDNTAKFKVVAKYINRGGERNRFLVKDKQQFVSTKTYELHYGQPPICSSILPTIVIRNDPKWRFGYKVKLETQYGGNCEVRYSPTRVINFTIHHRKGDLVNPWSCTSD